MDEIELVNIIESKVSSGLGGDDGGLSKTRQTILDRYLGELYGDEKDGQSKVTTREVFETVEWAMPSIVRVFESGDRIAEFDAVSGEDEQGAEQETDVVNHIYRKDNKGFVVTHNIIKSALINPNSYVKVYRDEKVTVETERYEQLIDQELAMLMNDDEVEIVGADRDEQGFFSVEIKRTVTRGKNIVKNIPEDEIIVDSNHNELSLDDCEFVCHQADKSYSELLQLDYNENDLDEAYSSEGESSEESNRRSYSDENDNDDESHKALRKYRVFECYMLLDWDDDGIAEKRRVVKIGSKIFENEELDMMPIVSAASMIMPHKHTGLSLAQTIIDLQDLKTYFMRQTVNNMARVNNPRTLITKGANLADMLSNRNHIVRIEKMGDVTTEPTTPIIGQVLPLLDLIDQQKEGRSGVTKNSMGLDANILTQATEGAFMGAIEKAEQRIEFIVRVFAETAFTDIFLKLHHLVLTHGDSKEMKLNGQWVMVNPSEWKKRESMTVNVGLGLGNKDQKMMSARVIIAEQDKDMQMGQMVQPQSRYNARRLLVLSTGEKNVDKYFPNPAMQPPPQPQPQQPDPNMMMLQQNGQIEANKDQTKRMELQQQAQIKAAEMQDKRQTEMIEARYKEMQLQNDMQIENLKLQLSQEKVDNDAGKTALMAQIDKLEINQKELQADAKLAMDKYAVDANNSTKIQLKQMDYVEPDSSVFETGQNEIKQMIAALSVKTDEPKTIIYDEQGNAVGVHYEYQNITKNIIRNEDGLPESIQ